MSVNSVINALFKTFATCIIMLLGLHLVATTEIDIRIVKSNDSIIEEVANVANGSYSLVKRIKGFLK